MTQISKEYAEALFSLESESGDEKKIMNDLKNVKTAFEESEELMPLLCSPSVSLCERLEIIDNIFCESICEHALSFLKILCERKRLSQLFECISEYEKLLSAKEAIVTAKVISAVPLTENEKNALREKLQKSSGGKVVLDCSVDETILGGVIVEMLGKVTDGSLRHRLKEIKEVMI